MGTLPSSSSPSSKHSEKGTWPKRELSEEQMLLPTLARNEAFSGEHASDLDVTGGIGLKVDRGFMVLESGIEVLLVSGEHEGRVRSACLGREVRGTRLVP